MFRRTTCTEAADRPLAFFKQDWLTFCHSKLASVLGAHVPHGIYNSVSWPCTWTQPHGWKSAHPGGVGLYRKINRYSAPVRQTRYTTDSFTTYRSVTTRKNATEGARERFVASRSPPTVHNGTALWLNSENWAVVFLRTGFWELVMCWVSRKLLQGDFFPFLPPPLQH